MQATETRPGLVASLIGCSSVSQHKQDFNVQQYQQLHVWLMIPNRHQIYCMSDIIDQHVTAHQLLFPAVFMLAFAFITSIRPAGVSD